MSNIDYIINLCHDIKEQGKTPSVAIIRNLATKPVSIPEVIKAIKHWKSNPDIRPQQNSIAKKAKSLQHQTLEQRVELLETQLADVIKELSVLQSKFT